MTKQRRKRLRSLFDSIEGTYGASYLSMDPVELVRPYEDKRDIELAGVLAAGLAFGNVKAIRASVRRLLATLGEEPAKALSSLKAPEIARLSEGHGHRWIRGSHLAGLLHSIAKAQRRHGDLETLFLRGDEGGPSLAAAMDAFVLELPGIRPFFSAPRAGSACKRFCMFLRWMVRGPDAIDLGIWRGISKTRLTIPLDVHLQRLARELRLTERKSGDWKAACEVTLALRELCPEDPLRYDFALCRLGMLTARSRFRAARDPISSVPS